MRHREGAVAVAAAAAVAAAVRAPLHAALLLSFYILLFNVLFRQHHPVDYRAHSNGGSTGLDLSREGAWCIF